MCDATGMQCVAVCCTCATRTIDMRDTPCCKGSLCVAMCCIMLQCVTVCCKRGTRHAQHARLIHESSIYDTLTCAAYTYTDVRTLTRMSCTRVIYIRHTVMRDLRDTHVLQMSHLHTTLSHAQPTPTLTCTTYTHTHMHNLHPHSHAQHACLAHESSTYDALACTTRAARLLRTRVISIRPTHRGDHT